MTLCSPELPCMCGGLRRAMGNFGVTTCVPRWLFHVDLAAGAPLSFFRVSPERQQEDAVTHLSLQPALALGSLDSSHWVTTGAHSRCVTSARWSDLRFSQEHHLQPWYQARVRCQNFPACTASPRPALVQRPGHGSSLTSDNGSYFRLQVRLPKFNILPDRM